MLCIAGGSGITPILSILKTVLASGGRATLLCGNRNAASTMSKEELENLKNQHLTHFALHTVFSRERDCRAAVRRPSLQQNNSSTAKLVQPVVLYESLMLGTGFAYFCASTPYRETR